MNLSDLLTKDKIRKINSDMLEVKETIKKAGRDLQVAKQNLPFNFDWAFNIAYNSMILSARALMFKDGYTPSGEDHHKTTIEYADVKLGKVCPEIIEYFKKMRPKRHTSVYFSADTISEHEAKYAIECAEKFLKIVKEKLGV